MVGAEKYASNQPQVKLAWHLINMFDIPPVLVEIPAGDPYAGGVSGWEYTKTVWLQTQKIRLITYATFLASILKS